MPGLGLAPLPFLVEHERAGAENDKVLSRVTSRFFAHCGVVNGHGEVFEWGGLPLEEEQFCLVEVDLEVGRHPSLYICQAHRYACRYLGVRRG